MAIMTTSPTATTATAATTVTVNIMKNIFKRNKWDCLLDFTHH